MSEKGLTVVHASEKRVCGICFEEQTADQMLWCRDCEKRVTIGNEPGCVCKTCYLANPFLSAARQRLYRGDSCPFCRSFAPLVDPIKRRDGDANFLPNSMTTSVGLFREMAPTDSSKLAEGEKQFKRMRDAYEQVMCREISFKQFKNFEAFFQRSEYHLAGEEYPLAGENSQWIRKLREGIDGMDFRKARLCKKHASRAEWSENCHKAVEARDSPSWSQERLQWELTRKGGARYALENSNQVLEDIADKRATLGTMASKTAEELTRHFKTPVWPCDVVALDKLWRMAVTKWEKVRVICLARVHALEGKLGLPLSAVDAPVPAPTALAGAKAKAAGKKRKRQ